MADNEIREVHEAPVYWATAIRYDDANRGDLENAIHFAGTRGDYAYAKHYQLRLDFLLHSSGFAEGRLTAFEALQTGELVIEHCEDCECKGTSAGDHSILITIPRLP